MPPAGAPDSARLAATFCSAMSAAGIEKPLFAAAMTVVGEAGEMVEALRRYLAYARRIGSLDEVAAELADVELSAHVYAYRAGEPWSAAFDLVLGVRQDDAGPPRTRGIQPSPFMHGCGWHLRGVRRSPRALRRAPGRVVFACLNPSKAGRMEAGVEISDPSATRMAGFTRSWGYGAFTIVNVFAYIATDPRTLVGLDRVEAFGWDNAAHIRDAVNGAALVVAAWGSSYPRALAEAVGDVRGWLRLAAPVHHLGLTKGGDPRHPLYLRGDTLPVRWVEGAQAQDGKR